MKSILKIINYCPVCHGVFNHHDGAIHLLAIEVELLEARKNNPDFWPYQFNKQLLDKEIEKYSNL